MTSLNEQMIDIAKTLYLQTRYAQASLVIEDRISVSEMRQISFEFRVLDEDKWIVKDWEPVGDIHDMKLKDSMTDSLKTTSQGIFLIGVSEGHLIGLLFATEGVIADYRSSLENNIISFESYSSMEACMDEAPGRWSVRTGEPLHKPIKWDQLMKCDHQ
tara:strand:+ start:1398 stop:1874 length:477 start_codon:yes stop_codon:yes gene_type:complete